MNNLETEKQVAEFQDYKQGYGKKQKVYLEDLNPDSTYAVGRLFPYDDLSDAWHYSNKAGDWYTEDLEEAELLEELLACLYYLETYDISTDKDYSEIPSLAREHGFVI